MAKATIIRRINPKTGEIERPWQDRRGNYILGDPGQGALLHHREKAVVTSDYNEAVALVRKGFSIRMCSEGRPAALIRSASLTIDEIDANDADALTEQRLTAPFTKEKVFSDLRRALVAQAAVIAYWGSREAAETFIGLNAGDGSEPYDDANPAEVDLDRFAATRIVSVSYDYAFQTGEPTRFGPEEWGDLGSMIDSATPGVITAISPMIDPKSALRVTTDTAFARWKLDVETWLPITARQLALLAQMDEVAARNALSKEGISARGGIVNDDARRWLEKRRGYISTKS